MTNTGLRERMRPLASLVPNKALRRFKIATCTAALVLAACSSSGFPERDYEASVIRQEVMSSLDDPSSDFHRYWVRTTGTSPNASFRQYVETSSDDEIETTAQGACEAVFAYYSVEIDFFREDFDAVREAEAHLDNFVVDLLERNEPLARNSETIADLKLWSPFVEAACPDLLLSPEDTHPWLS